MMKFRSLAPFLIGKASCWLFEMVMNDNLVYDSGCFLKPTSEVIYNKITGCFYVQGSLGLCLLLRGIFNSASFLLSNGLFG